LDQTIQETLEEENNLKMLTKFNKIYKQYSNYLIINFNLSKADDKLNHDISYYYNHFIINLLPYMDEISVNNIDYFWYSQENIELTEGIKFKKLLKSLKRKRKMKNMIL